MFNKLPNPLINNEVVILLLDIILKFALIIDEIFIINIPDGLDPWVFQKLRILFRPFLLNKINDSGLGHILANELVF